MDGQKRAASPWRQFLKIVAVTVPYLIPLFWLWNKTDYPDSLGIHIEAHGKAGVVEHWWYSYLLLERAEFWDVVLFAYMWLPAAALLVWGVWLFWLAPAVKSDRPD